MPCSALPNRLPSPEAAAALRLQRQAKKPELV
jgi:hypothetical protein